MWVHNSQKEGRNKLLRALAILILAVISTSSRSKIRGPARLRMILASEESSLTSAICRKLLAAAICSSSAACCLLSRIRPSGGPTGYWKLNDAILHCHPTPRIFNCFLSWPLHAHDTIIKLTYLSTYRLANSSGSRPRMNQFLVFNSAMIVSPRTSYVVSLLVYNYSVIFSRSHLGLLHPVLLHTSSS